MIRAQFPGKARKLIFHCISHVAVAFLQRRKVFPYERSLITFPLEEIPASLENYQESFLNVNRP